MIKDFTLKLKSVDAGGTFTGLAATYNGLDMVGDTIVPGAFKQAIAQQGAGYPLLFAHDQSQPLGVGKISDSTSGLIVNGSLVLADPNAVRAQAHMRAGSIRGLSIGYTIPDGRSETQRDGTRLLKEVRLHEISLVAVPADPGAQVTSVKSAQAVLASLRTGNISAEDRGALVSTLKLLLSKDASCECLCPQCLLGDCQDCSNEDCVDPNCEGNEVQTLSALKELAAELRNM
jgi:HK97 family phage prohead protease